MKDKFKTIVLLFFFCQTLNTLGQLISNEDENEIQLDDDIKFGTLSNGMSYYIKNLPESQEKVDVRFYIKAGSNHEDSDQLNMAHFVEHMAFKSSKHFPNGVFNESEIWNKLNMSPFDLGGQAQRELTRYTFKAPSGNKEAITTAFNWFNDIADGLHFKEKEIEDERGALIQEFIFRTGKSISHGILREKLQVELFPCIGDYSNFIEHQKTVKSERLKQFYDAWYRPELMTILVVGNVGDVQRIEELIKKQFYELKAHTDQPRETPDCRNDYFNQPPRFALVEADPNLLEETDLVETNLYFKMANFNSKISAVSAQEHVQLRIKLDLIVGIISKRFKEISNVYNNLFNSSIRNVNYPPSVLVTINSKGNSEQRAYKSTFQILQQFQKYGALANEFQDAVNNQLGILNGMDPNKHRFWIERIEEYIKDGYTLSEKDIDSLKSWLASYSFNDFQEFVASNGFESPQDIGIIAPSGHETLNFTEQEVRSCLKRFSREPTSVYSLPEIPQSLMKHAEINNLNEKKIEDKGDDEFDARELILGNGVRVLLKPFKPTTGSHQDRLILHGFNNSGAFSFPKNDYYSALNAAEFIKNSGVGNLNKFELQRYLASTSIKFPLLNLYINNQESGVKVDANLEDLEKMLQLVYLYFTKPRIDKTAFQDWKNWRKVFFKNPLMDFKQVDLQEQINKIIGNYSEPPYGSERYEGIDETSMNRGVEVYKELFGNGQDFTFVLSGDFSTVEVLPLVNKYLGNLPNSYKREFKRVKTYHQKLKGPVLIQLEARDTISNANFTYRPYYVTASDTNVNLETKIKAEALGRIVDLKLWELRFKKGYSLYTLGARLTFNDELQQFEFSARINCTPEEYPYLREEFLEIIKDIKSGLVSQELLDQGFQEIEQKYNPEGKIGSQETIQNNLYKHVRFGTPSPDLEKIRLSIKSLSKDKIVEAAQKYFKDENLFEFVLSPVDMVKKSSSTKDY